jgi:hypothetical protein
VAYRVIISFIIALKLFAGVELSAQIHDYAHPFEYPFEFHHLQLTLEIPEEETVFRGVATWQMSAKTDNSSKIELIAIRTDIKSVRINERSVDYRAKGDTLIIAVEEPFPSFVRFKLEIVYLTDTKFGVHQTKNGTIWSSLLPGARSDLFPSIPHPSVQVPTDIRLIMHHEWKGVANGYLLATTLLPEDQRLYHWRSEIPIAVTDIAIVAGRLDFTEVRQAGKRYRIYSEEDAYSDEDRAAIMERTLKYSALVESSLDTRIPFEGFNVILLPDHRWETRFSSGSITYLFENGGDRNEQLMRGLISQFFGSAQRGPDLKQSHVQLAIQGYFFNALKDSVEIDDSIEIDHYPEFTNTPWLVWSPDYWSYAKAYRNTEFERILAGGLNRIGRLNPGMFSWERYLKALGIEQAIAPPVVSKPEEISLESYTVYYYYDDISNRYDLELVPNGNYAPRFMPLRIRQFESGNASDLELLVSTRGDHIHLNISQLVQNLYVINDNPDISFIEIKPANFWVYQLRNDGDPVRRNEAAKGFALVQDDPDVQFILQELIANEPDNEVKANLVTSHARLLNGGAGTHTRFVSLLRDPSRVVRFAALDALKYYKNIEAAQREVFRIISSSNDVEYVNKAIEVYSLIVNEREFFSVARSLLFEDREELNFTHVLIPLIVKSEQGQTFAPNLMGYMDESYDYSLRKLTFDTLKMLKISPSYWQDILPYLLADKDPRIRYMSLELAKLLEQKAFDEIITERYFNEYDVRVLQKLQQLRN